jgi:hypothetical protein
MITTQENHMRFIKIFAPDHPSRRHRLAAMSKANRPHKVQSRGRPYKFESNEHFASVMRGRDKIWLFIRRGIKTKVRAS